MKKHKIQAKWIAAPGDPWPTQEIQKPRRKPGFSKSIWRAIYNELMYRRQIRKWTDIGKGVEKEIEEALGTSQAVEIAKEIDKEILADIAKAMGIPKVKL